MDPVPGYAGTNGRVMVSISENTRTLNTMRLICFFILLFLAACVSEGITSGDGYAFDAKTRQPLDSVLVKSYYRKKGGKQFKRQMVTDTTGYFHGSTGLVGCPGDECPDLIIELIKEGYVTREVINPYKDSVYLE